MKISNTLDALRRLYVFLASGRLAVVLLAVLVLLTSVYLWVPQEGQMEAEALEGWVKEMGFLGEVARAAGLTDMLGSWLLSTTYGLLIVNLLLCMIRRLGTTIEACRAPEKVPLLSWFPLCRELAGEGLQVDRVDVVLRRKGYRTLLAGETVYGLRGRLARAGHWIFHVGLLVLLLGGVFVAVTPEPFRGTVGIGEGESFDLHSTPFLATTLPVSPDLADLRFRLEAIDVVTRDGRVREFDALLSTPEGDEVRFGINRPYRNRPYQVLVNGFGYMPGWVIVDPRGRMLRGAWVKLAPFPLEEEDSFSLGSTGSQVTFRFYPDHESVDGEERSPSQELRNPKFAARIAWRGERVFDGLLDPDQRVPLGGGREFFFLSEIRKYSMLDVIYEKGYGVIFAGLGITVLGLGIRYARLRKEILVQITGGTVRVYGRSEILESLFAEELDRLAVELGQAGPSADDPGGAA